MYMSHLEALLFKPDYVVSQVLLLSPESELPLYSAVVTANCFQN